MNKQQRKNLQILFGVILSISGLSSSIPLFLKENFGLAISGVFLLVIGLILIALGFSD